MKFGITYGLLTALCLFSTKVGLSQSRPATSRLEIVLLTDLIGYVEPCGCTVDVMLGGIDRLVGHSLQSEFEQAPTEISDGAHFLRSQFIAIAQSTGQT